MVRLEINETPREFNASGIKIKDFGRVHLDSDEMITIISSNGKKCDFTAKEWGFYLAPSLNGRLKREGFKVALVRNCQNKLFLNAVEADKMELFLKYLKNQDSSFLCWLDEWCE